MVEPRYLVLLIRFKFSFFYNFLVFVLVFAVAFAHAFVLVVVLDAVVRFSVMLGMISEGMRIASL